jgi:hypothetical protein
MTDIIARLRACGADVTSRVPEVNKGGCGVYAAKVAMALEDAGLTVWAVVSSALRDDDLNVVRNESRPYTLNQWNGAGVYMSHVLVQFEHRGRVWTHDARNTTCRKTKQEPSFGGRLVPGYLTVPELVTIAMARKGWNPAFDRRSGIPVVRTAVRRHLSA